MWQGGRIVGPTILVLILVGMANGCGARKPENVIENSGLELPTSSNGLPESWSMTVASGDYEVGATESAHTGRSALLLAGSRGEAEVGTNPCPIAGGSVIECEAWLQAEVFNDAEVAVFIKSPTLSAGKTYFNPTSRDWQQLHFFMSALDVAAGSSAALGIQLQGDGLVRIDDLVLKVIPPSSVTHFIVDHGFEKPEVLNRKARETFPEWKFMADEKDSKYEILKQSPRSGNSCVRLQGSKGWSVMVSRYSITPRTARMFAQGFMRVQHGEGGLKFDYIKNGNCFASTYSPQEGSSEWSFISVEGDPELAAKSDEVKAAFAARNGEGEFSVDFDDVEVFVVQ